MLEVVYGEQTHTCLPVCLFLAAANDQLSISQRGGPLKLHMEPTSSGGGGSSSSWFGMTSQEGWHPGYRPAKHPFGNTMLIRDGGEDARGRTVGLLLPEMTQPQGMSLSRHPRQRSPSSTGVFKLQPGQTSFICKTHFIQSMVRNQNNLSCSSWRMSLLPIYFLERGIHYAIMGLFHVHKCV